MTLEGRCRVHVRDVALSTLQEMFVATVEQLDYFGLPPGAGTGSAHSSNTGKAAGPGAVGGGPFKAGSAAARRGAEEGGILASRHQEELVAGLLQARPWIPSLRIPFWIPCLLEQPVEPCCRRGGWGAGLMHPCALVCPGCGSLGFCSKYPCPRAPAHHPACCLGRQPGCADSAAV